MQPRTHNTVLEIVSTLQRTPSDDLSIDYASSDHAPAMFRNLIVMGSCLTMQETLNNDPHQRSRTCNQDLSILIVFNRTRVSSAVTRVSQGSSMNLSVTDGNRLINCFRQEIDHFKKWQERPSRYNRTLWLGCDNDLAGIVVGTRCDIEEEGTIESSSWLNHTTLIAIDTQIECQKFRFSHNVVWEDRT